MGNLEIIFPKGATSRVTLTVEIRSFTPQLSYPPFLIFPLLCVTCRSNLSESSQFRAVPDEREDKINTAAF
jgi:hypothetical protein